MKVMEKRLKFFESQVSQNTVSKKSKAIIAYNCERPGLNKVRVTLLPATGDPMAENAPDFEEGRRALERMTKGFSNPVEVFFYEDTRPFQDQILEWDGKALPTPTGGIWSEILHRGMWVVPKE
jgi:hypothetical protein